MLSDFLSQYKDPRWQRKRLEKMNAAGWACERCRSEDKSLQVHHREYKKGRKVWEYEPAELEVLCDDCHEREHVSRRTLMDLLPAWLGVRARNDLTSFILGYVWTVYEDPIERQKIAEKQPVPRLNENWWGYGKTDSPFERIGALANLMEFEMTEEERCELERRLRERRRRRLGNALH